MDTFIQYILPRDPANFTNCVDSLKVGIDDALIMIKKVQDNGEEGSKEMDLLICFRQPALCVGITCCGSCVYADTVSEMKSDTCESICLGKHASKKSTRFCGIY